MNARGVQRAFTVAAADYGIDHVAIRSVRFAVFVDEQAVPAELEMDERDAECFHVLARDLAGRAVGTGRLDVAAGCRIGRMAVLSDWRGAGVGAQILAALHAHARSAGHRSAWCHAQLAARGFYERAGYQASGDTFEEAYDAAVEIAQILLQQMEAQGLDLPVPTSVNKI